MKSCSHSGWCNQWTSQAAITSIWPKQSEQCCSKTGHDPNAYHTYSNDKWILSEVRHCQTSKDDWREQFIKQIRASERWRSEQASKCLWLFMLMTIEWIRQKTRSLYTTSLWFARWFRTHHTSNEIQAYWWWHNTAQVKRIDWLWWHQRSQPNFHRH